MNAPEFEFDWNDEVVVANNAPTKFGPSKTGAVVGMRIVENEMQASAAEVSIGTVLYLVEYADGNSAEVPAFFLRRVDP